LPSVLYNGGGGRVTGPLFRKPIVKTEDTRYNARVKFRFRVKVMVTVTVVDGVRVNGYNGLSK